MALDPASSEFFDSGKYVFAKSDKSSKSPEQMVKVLRETGEPVSHYFHRRWHGGGRLGRLKMITDAAARRFSLSATTSSSPTRSFSRRALRWAWQLHPDQGQPDRNADRDADAIEMAKCAGYTAVSATAAARRRTRPLRTSPWRPMPARSRPGRPAGPDPRAKYNQLIRIEEQLGDAAIYPGLAAFKRG